MGIRENGPSLCVCDGTVNQTNRHNGRLAAGGRGKCITKGGGGGVGMVKIVCVCVCVSELAETPDKGLVK